MQNIMPKIIEARSDMDAFNELANQYESLIMHAVYKATGEFVTKDSDEYSVALIAFREAVMLFNEKGSSFDAFASKFVRRRVKEYRKNHENTKNNNKNKPNIIRTPLQEEIIALQDIVRRYDFALYDLIYCVPKSERISQICADIIDYIVQNKNLVTKTRQLGMIPHADIQGHVKVSEHIVKHYRRYLITGIEIMYGQFKILNQYFNGLTRTIRQEPDFGDNKKPMPEAIVLETRNNKAAVLWENGNITKVCGNYTAGERITQENITGERYNRKDKRFYRNAQPIKSLIPLILKIILGSLTAGLLGAGIYAVTQPASYITAKTDAVKIMMPVNYLQRVIGVKSDGRELQLVSDIDKHGIYMLPVKGALDVVQEEMKKADIIQKNEQPEVTIQTKYAWCYKELSEQLDAAGYLIPLAGKQ